MPIVGSIVKSGSAIQFLCARTESGSPLEVPRESSEEMTTPGVDGRRWRTVQTLHPEFVLSTVTECATHNEAVKLRNKVEALTNKLVQLYLTIDGASYFWTDVHVNTVMARAVPGVVVAVGSTNGQGHLVCEWSLTMTDFAQQTKQ